ncbi:arylesterase [Inquilinus sp. KBS0705]|nr:arylesterase [Inquilinus sp. KBS0705]
MVLAVLITGCNSKTTDKKSDADTDTTQAAKTAATKNILVFGDSLTAGYGLDDASEAFPGVLQNKIDSAKLPYNVINAGVSGETSAGGRARIAWTLKQPVDIFVLELGANDGLRGLPVKQTTENLQFIINTVKAKYPKAKLVLLGMLVPPNMGADYANNFKNIFPQLAAKNNMTLMPFLLQDVAGVRSLNQPDGIHPTAEGAKIVGANVWKVIKGLL